MMTPHIGQMVERAFRQMQNDNPKCTAVWLADRLHCNRRNLYDIFQRPSIDTQLLMQICTVIGYNIFDDLADLTRQRQAQVRRDNPLAHAMCFMTTASQSPNRPNYTALIDEYERNADILRAAIIAHRTSADDDATCP